MRAMNFNFGKREQVFVVKMSDMGVPFACSTANETIVYTSMCNNVHHPPPIHSSSMRLKSIKDIWEYIKDILTNRKQSLPTRKNIKARAKRTTT